MTIFYHYPCLDGFTANYILNKNFGYYLPEIKFEPFFRTKEHAELYPELKNTTIMFIDCAPEASELVNLLSRNNSIYIIDHHQSSFDTLAELPNVEYLEETSLGDLILNALASTPPRNTIKAYLDNNKSGAYLAYLLTSKGHMPEGFKTLAEYVSDRDLWLFKMGNDTRALNAYLESLPMTLKAWDENILDYILNNDFKTPIAIGTGLLNLKSSYVDRICRNIFYVDYYDEVLPCDATRSKRLKLKAASVNSPILQSEIGNHILETDPSVDFAMVWFYETATEQCRVSLRSRKETITYEENGVKIEKLPVDVNLLAKFYFNGGGHRSASGGLADPEDLV